MIGRLHFFLWYGEEKMFLWRLVYTIQLINRKKYYEKVNNIVGWIDQLGNNFTLWMLKGIFNVRREKEIVGLCSTIPYFINFPYFRSSFSYFHRLLVCLIVCLIVISVSDPDPVGSVSFGRIRIWIRIRIRKRWYGSG